jgi:RNA polymerase sigma-70 factor (ECF subfamily)
MGRADHKAFEILVRQHHRRVLAYALSLTHHKDAAEDIVQDAFVTAFRRLKDFDPARDFGAWVRGMVRNKYLQWVRSRKARAVGDDVLESLESRHQEWDRAAEEDRGESLDALRRCLSTLEDASREVIDLFYMKGQPCAGVASRLGVGEPVVRKRLERARRRLARCISKRLSITGRRGAN